MTDLVKPTQKYYRPISADGFTPVRSEGSVGPAIRMQWIALDRLFVDTRYQRPLNKGNKSNARQIARDFRWRRFAPVIVTPIPGTECFSIIDGQYKSTGILLRGIKMVPCAIVDAPTVEEQADSFKFLNANVTRIMQFDIYRAKLAADDSEAKSIEALATRCGIRLTGSGALKKDIQQGDCTTYKSFSAHAKNFKEPVFVAALSTLAKNQTSLGMINSTMIGAFCQLFKTNPTWISDTAVRDILVRANLRVLTTKAVEVFFKENTPKKVTIILLLRQHVLDHVASTHKHTPLENAS